jgi:hypothetical protein
VTAAARQRLTSPRSSQAITPEIAKIIDALVEDIINREDRRAAQSAAAGNTPEKV